MVVLLGHDVLEIAAILGHTAAFFGIMEFQNNKHQFYNTKVPMH